MWSSPLLIVTSFKENFKKRIYVEFISHVRGTSATSHKEIYLFFNAPDKYFFIVY